MSKRQLLLLLLACLLTSCAGDDADKSAGSQPSNSANGNDPLDQSNASAGNSTGVGGPVDSGVPADVQTGGEPAQPADDEPTVDAGAGEPEPEVLGVACTVCELDRECEEDLVCARVSVTEAVGFCAPNQGVTECCSDTSGTRLCFEVDGMYSLPDFKCDAVQAALAGPLLDDSAEPSLTATGRYEWTSANGTAFELMALGLTDLAPALEVNGDVITVTSVPNEESIDLIVTSDPCFDWTGAQGLSFEIASDVADELTVVFFAQTLQTTYRQGGGTCYGDFFDCLGPSSEGFPVATGSTEVSVDFAALSGAMPSGELTDVHAFGWQIVFPAGTNGGAVSVSNIRFL